MIFDDICKNIEFKVIKRDGEWDYVVNSGEFHLAERLKKGKISLVDLINAFEDDKDKVTINFNEDRDGILTAEINFYSTDDLVDWLAEVVLETFNGFYEYLSRYCGAR